MEQQASNIKQVHQKLLGILEFVDRICRENNLKYYLAYGTLLGAVRHKGFIPWDDDVDLWMPREDYNKLLEILRTSNKSERFVLCENYYAEGQASRPIDLIMRVFDLETKIDAASSKSIEYLWLDVLPLDKVYLKKQKSYLKSFNRKMFKYKIARAKKHLINQKSLFGLCNKVIYTMHNKMGFFKHTLDEEKCIKKAVDSLRKYEKEPDVDGYFCYAFVYLNTPHKCFFKKEMFDESIELEFEGLKCLAPKEYDALLRTVYNDYMQLPPEDQRVYHGVQIL